MMPASHDSKIVEQSGIAFADQNAVTHHLEGRQPVEPKPLPRFKVELVEGEGASADARRE